MREALRFAVSDAPARSDLRREIPHDAGLRVASASNEDDQRRRGGCDARPRRGLTRLRTRTDRKRGVA
jgi:hypothetical protein